ncbi:hypothetical protein GCG54_00001048 [Colletotrichum gloeosporioides]|uniref:Nucleoside phosphorylase domain-containing protein n=1 Tax=Colletotrichum gloeosporioides TaxID=474922 RepID=A0A8H4FFE8_COLGL|nr:uncharacterized protein GCG54_00001048 [Colletotrichum gloeosporioides]KAF3799940.1 hypothetical protein GCG54_00001048 [Colletotrichum gloeosporioides]
MSENILEEDKIGGKRTFGEGDSDDSRRGLSKRRRASRGDVEDDFRARESDPQSPSNVRLQREDYTLGWICALPIELAASRAMMDCIHETLPTPENDSNAYILGNIGTHNIVMACLPTGNFGTNNAADVASNLLRSFTSVRVSFMVGIGGGVPSDAVDIRLGDIVVGESVIQHDLGKMTSQGLQGTASATKPPLVLLKAVSKLRAIHESMQSLTPFFLNDMQERYSELSHYSYPASANDRLFVAAYEHDRSTVTDCSNCSEREIRYRRRRGTTNPRIHYGGVASGNQVIKSGLIRDDLAEKLGVICFEMEAAGVANTLPGIVIRGICDYSDSHKNKQWQRYAAATAAAYTKELVTALTPDSIVDPYPRGTPIDNWHKKLQICRKHLLQSLRFDQIDARYKDIKTAQIKTCEWLLHDPFYEQWLDPSLSSKHLGFLWLSGKPGAGKSTIMKFASTRASKTSGKDTAIIFFSFNARGQAIEKTIFGLYRSLLFQILERFPDLQQVLDDPALISVERIKCPTVDALQELLRDAIRALGQRHLICFIDALDECDETQVREMVVFFEDLGEQAVETGVRLNVCFSSRHYPHVNIRHSLKLTLEAQPGHGQDLEKYVNRRLRVDESPRVDNLRAEILHKAGGVFMWVVLVVEILNKELTRGSWFRAEKRLREIPRGLSELFQDLLRRDDYNKDELLLCIQWILFSARPMTTQEFYFAMLSGLPDFHQEMAAYNPRLDADKMMKLFIVGSSKGLAEVTESGRGTVQFIHESVADFFMKDGGIKDLWPELDGNFRALSHEKLKQCCFSHVGPHSVAANLSLEIRKARCMIADKFPFLRYAAKHVLHHANAAAESLSQDEFTDQFPLKDWVRLTDLLENGRFSRSTSTTTFVYILAENNFVTLLQHYIRRHPEVHPKGEWYGYPLFAALSKGHWAAAKTLLGQADPYCDHNELFLSTNHYRDFGSFKGADSTPLHWSIETGHKALAKILIDSAHFDCTSLNTKGQSPVHSAAIAGNKDALVLLLGKCGSSDEQVTDESNSLSRAVKTISDPQSIYRQERLRHINLRDHSGKRPISIAVGRHHPDLVQQLIEWGATLDDDIFTPGSTRSTLLSLASRHGHLHGGLTQLLIDRGLATIQTFLRLAIVRDDLMAMQVLEDEASIDDVDANGHTPLEIAFMHGRLSMAERLVRRGANIERVNQHGHAPLHHAAFHGSKTLVKLLIDLGATIDHQDLSGQTALHTAASFGHSDAIKVLLKEGASTRVVDSHRMTPLQLAMHQGRFRAANILLGGKGRLRFLA